MPQVSTLILPGMFKRARARRNPTGASTRGPAKDVAHSAVAGGPSGLQPLKWEPGTDRPAFAGLPAGAPVAGAPVGGSSTVAVNAHVAIRTLSCCSAWTPTPYSSSAPALDAPADSPAKAGRSAPGSDFSDRRPARGPSAGAESAASFAGPRVDAPVGFLLARALLNIPGRIRVETCGNDAFASQKY